MTAARLWHEIAKIPWGAWVAAVALIVGVGTFLDEYYVGNDSRTRMRDRIARLLKKLEDGPVVLKSMASSLPDAWPLLWGIVPLAVYFIGHRIPAGRYHGIADFLVALTLVFMIWYSFMLIPILIALLIAIVLVAGATTFYLSKYILWIVFRPAADPNKSPFKFLTGMVSVWVLFAKFLIEATK